jgi:hypothetical protein
MKKLSVLIIILLVKCLFLSLQSFSQDINITGLVINSNQQPVANVKISLAGSPQIICYTNQNGEFLLSNTSTGVTQLIEENVSMHMKSDGGIEITAYNQSFIMTIYNLMGMAVGPSIHMTALNGTYIIYPAAYVQNLPKGIYIARIILGNQQKSFKINNFNQNTTLKGFFQIGYSSNRNISINTSNIKSEGNEAIKGIISDEDTLIFNHDFYKVKRLAVTSHNLDVGTIELENFGDYSPAVGVDPDKIIFYKQNGNFLNVYGQDSSQFIICIDSYSIMEEELEIKAIPVQKFEFLDPTFKFISGIHLEPSGTHFFIPVHVNVELNNIVYTDSVIVMLHNNETGETCYVPFSADESYGMNSNIEFFISHFSDIVICKGKLQATQNKSFVDSDDATSYIATQIQLGAEISDDIFEQWYNDVIKYEIAGSVDMETLKFAIAEFALMGQCAIYSGRSFEGLNFYEEAINGFNDKYNYLFNLLKEEYSNLSDLCLRRDLSFIVIQLNEISQYIQGINELPLIELGEDVLKIVNKITIKNPAYIIGPNKTTQIEYEVKNIINEKIAASLEWYSDDPEIVQVDDTGKITAFKEGTTYIHARFSCDIEDSVEVKVTNESGDPCLTLPRPIIGKYKTRILIHCYYRKDYEGIGYHHWEHWVALDIYLLFTEDGRDMEYYGTYNDEDRDFTVDYNPPPGYANVNYYYSNYTRNLCTYLYSLNGVGDMKCYDKFYYLSDTYVSYVRIYINSRTAEGTYLFDEYGLDYEKTYIGFGKLYKPTSPNNK